MSGKQRCETRAQSSACPPTRRDRLTGRRWLCRWLLGTFLSVGAGVPDAHVIELLNEEFAAHL